MIAFGISPALAPGKAAPYVIAAYVVFLAVILIYVAIMARRLTKTESDLAELKRDLDHSRRSGELAPQPSSEREQEPVG
jgi:hypothetical protein